MSRLPDIRLSLANPRPLVASGEYVLYWMTMNRRAAFNPALEHAAQRAAALDRPLVVLEPLRLDYPWASERLHAFILQGMAHNQAALAGLPVFYYPYVEPRLGAGKGLLAALAAKACLVVADRFPCFFLPRMLAAAARLDARLEAVDACGLLPLRATDHAFPTAYAFRRHLQQTLPGHLAYQPREHPLEDLALPQPVGPPGEILRRWPPAPPEILAADPDSLAGLALDHAVKPSPLAGGGAAALSAWRSFLARGLERYHQDHSQPQDGATSGLSPYLHFGHISTHQVFLELAQFQGWSPQRLGPVVRGKREGWWGMSPGAESFLDQLVTWRELGFNCCQHQPDYDQYGSLPAWAQATLAAHAADPRPWLYSPGELARGATHDPVWNAAQGQLAAEGIMPGYLRMLWGKKILEWSPSPQAALTAMIQLNNRYALDGRDPNSHAGIFWVLGRYDRPFARRAVLGQVRYMSSASARRKLRLLPYLERHGRGPGQA